MTTDLVWAFVTGLAGSLHCLGMCGPIVIAYSLHLQGSPAGSPAKALRKPWGWGASLSHHMAFHTGRIATYSLWGALAAGFVHFAGSSSLLLGYRNLASLAGGLIVIAMGLVLLGVIPGSFFAEDASSGKDTLVRRLVIPLVNSHSLVARLGLGAAAGCLPCMMLWALLFRAAMLGNPLQGFGLMLSFGLGTVPVLLLVGVHASLLSLRVRLAGERVAALSLVAMGCILTFKGMAHLV